MACHGGFVESWVVGEKRTKDGVRSCEFLVFKEFIWVVVSNILYFHPYLGKESVLTNIFQMG